MNTTEVLTSKALISFIEQLRFAGYNIGVAQYIAAQNLFLALAAQGKMPSELTELRTFLAPILCHSPKEQAAFKNHFDRWINQLSKAHLKSEPIAEPTATPLTVFPNSPIINKGISLWKWAMVLMVLILGISVYWVDITNLFQGTTTPIEITPPFDETAQPETALPETPIEIDQAESTQVETEEKIKSRSFGDLSGWLPWLTLQLLFLFLFASLWRRYSQPSLARQTTATRPDIKKWFVEGIDDKLFQSASLSRTAQKLRQHINIPSARLDIMATLEKTLQAGGWLKPVMATMKSRPEYLVLIDRTTFNDHQAKFINSLINQIVAEDVFITRYYFDADPRRCYPEKKELPPRTLTELAQHYPTHRLMIFSDGNGFINPITGELVQWIEQLSIWLQRVLFTLETPAQWGYREQILDEADFLILPANEAGLTALAEQINIGTWQPYPAPSDSYAPAFPDYLNERPRRWLERHAPDAPMLTELLKQVRDFLGEEGYYWFSACAVYPEIRWQLTVYLGYQLKLLTEERFAKLARLPWFRYGNMPNWLRRRLVDDLSLEQEKAIRTELNVLWAKASDKPISDFCLEIAREQKARLSKLGKRLLSQWIKYSPKNSPLRDYVFLSFMPDKLAVKISNRVFAYQKMLQARQAPFHSTPHRFSRLPIFLFLFVLFIGFILTLSQKGLLNIPFIDIPADPVMIMTGAGVYLRIVPKWKTKWIKMLQIGTIVRPLEVRRIKEQDWYQVVTPTHEKGWVPGKYTMPIDYHKREKAYIKVAEKKLNGKTSYGDLVDLSHFLNRVSSEVTQTEIATKLKQLHFLTLQRLKTSSPQSKSDFDISDFDINEVYGIVATKHTPLNIRADMSIRAKIIYKAPKGSVLRILDKFDYWYQVKLDNGEIGYASRNYITIIAR